MENKITVADITLKTDIYIVTEGSIHAERIKSIQQSRKTSGHLLVTVGYREIEAKPSDTELSSYVFLNFDDARMRQLDLRLRFVEEAKNKLDKAMSEYHEAITNYGFDILTPKPEHEQKKQV